MGDKHKEKEKKQGVISSLLDLIKEVLGIFENLPKAMIGIALIASFAVGGTGAISSFMSPGSGDVKELKERVEILEIWNEALRQCTQALIDSDKVEFDSDKVEFDGYILDLTTGDIERLAPRK